MALDPVHVRFNAAGNWLLALFLCTVVVPASQVFFDFFSNHTANFFTDGGG